MDWVAFSLSSTETDPKATIVLLYFDVAFSKSLIAFSCFLISSFKFWPVNCKVMALITAAEVMTIVSTRNLDAGHILPAEIAIAENDYIKAAIGGDLYDAVVADVVTYADFIEDYIQPVLAYGILSNIWNRLSVEVTDRGINGFTGEGINTPQLQDKENTLFEIRQRLSSTQRSMIEYADEQYPALFDSQIDYVTDEVSYHSERTKRNNAL